MTRKEKSAARKVIKGILKEMQETPQTMLIGNDRYYWDDELNQWKPETYKFEKTR